MTRPQAMQSFFTRLKTVFDKIPIKARFLKDMNLNTSYSGFRYFMQDRNAEPSTQLMEKLCENMEYDLITIPVKRSADQQLIKQNLENTFFQDLDTHLEKYGDDPARTYVKHEGSSSVTAAATQAFSTDDTFDTVEKIDVSDLF